MDFALCALLAVSLIAVAALLAWGLTWREHARDAGRAAAFWQQEARNEQATRVDYERALRLPILHRGAVEAELWQRAVDGDEFAAEIMTRRMHRDIDERAGMPSRRRLPFASGRG